MSCTYTISVLLTQDTGDHRQTAPHAHAARQSESHMSHDTSVDRPPSIFCRVRRRRQADAYEARDFVRKLMRDRFTWPAWGRGLRRGERRDLRARALASTRSPSWPRWPRSELPRRRRCPAVPRAAPFRGRRTRQWADCPCDPRTST
eukprot:1057808-Prymnesium_polylepis.1